MEKLLQALDWPPVWTAGAVVLAWLAAQVLPWPVLGLAGPVLGVALVVAGVALMAAALREMMRARTTFIPRRAPSALVTSGIFRYSRNPIYLGDALVVAGAMLWFQVPWALPMLAVFVWVIETRFIRGEEEALTLAFGAEYGLWTGQVRRWIGRI